MVFYILATISLLLPIVVKNKKIYFMIMFVLMILVSGLRDSTVGSDTLEYHRLFYERQNMTIDELFSGIYYATEPGIWLLMQISNFFSSDAQLFVFVCSIVTYINLGIFLYKNTGNKFYEIAVFFVFAIGFFMYQMNVMRQAMGIAIACNSFTYMLRNEYKKAVLIVLLSSLVHYSLIILVPIIFLISILNKEGKSGIDRMKILFLVCGMLIGFFWGALSYIGDNLDILSISVQYQTYFDVTNKRSAEGDAGGYLIGLAVVYAALIAYTVFMEKECVSREKVFLESEMLSFAIVFTISIMFVMQVFYRFVDTFTIYVCLLIPDFIKNVKPTYMKPLAIVLVVLFGYISIWYILFKGFNGVSNYEFF